MDSDYCSSTMEISCISVVTPQQATLSLRYYRKFHLQNRGILAVTAVLPPSPLPCRALLRQVGDVPLGALLEHVIYALACVVRPSGASCLHVLSQQWLNVSVEVLTEFQRQRWK